MRYKAQGMDSYQTLVGGFDVELTFDDEDDNIMHVELFEAGASIFSTDLDISLFTNPDGETYTEDLIEDAAAAAVDLFEASRGTLGQGAEVLREANNMKKSACFESMYNEDWYMAFKGTPFQEQATTLLDSYLNTFAPSDPSNDVSMQIATTQREHEELIYRMDMLYFEKMKSDTGRKTVIVINAKTALYIDGLESWLNAFEGHKLEPQALALAKEYLDTEAKLQTLYEQREDPWTEREDLRFAMEELKIQLLQQNIEINLPDEGPELAPKMMNDMFELAEGVSFDEPLEPMHELPPEVYTSETLISPDPMFSMASRKKAEADEVTENEPTEVIEKGELHGDLDIAEIPVSEQPYEVGDSVTVSKAYELPLWGGGIQDISKGTKGVVDGLLDGNGDCVLVRLDMGDEERSKLVTIPVEHLGK